MVVYLATTSIGIVPSLAYSAYLLFAYTGILFHFHITPVLTTTSGKKKRKVSKRPQFRIIRTISIIILSILMIGAIIAIIIKYYRLVTGY
jgi:hypothetical protein